MSYAICFNLDQSKILSFGNGLSQPLHDDTGVSVDTCLYFVLSTTRNLKFLASSGLLTTPVKEPF